MVGENITVGKAEDLHPHNQLFIDQTRETGILKRLKTKLKPPKSVIFSAEFVTSISFVFVVWQHLNNKKN